MMNRVLSIHASDKTDYKNQNFTRQMTPRNDRIPRFRVLGGGLHVGELVGNQAGNDVLGCNVGPTSVYM